MEEVTLPHSYSHVWTDERTDTHIDKRTHYTDEHTERLTTAMKESGSMQSQHITLRSLSQPCVSAFDREGVGSQGVEVLTRSCPGVCHADPRKF